MLNQLQQNKTDDTIFALSAMCRDLLGVICAKQGQDADSIFNEYLKNYTEANVTKQQAEAKRKELQEILRATVSDFNDRAKSMYWSLLFMSEKDRTDRLNSMWKSMTEGVELPKGTKRPGYINKPPSEDRLLERRKELQAIIERNNKAQLEADIDFHERNIIGTTKAMEADLAKMTKSIMASKEMTKEEIQQSIKVTEARQKSIIRQRVQEHKRHIDSAKSRLNVAEDAKAELKNVNQFLSKLLIG
ncbi:hypothetical protein [Thalassotalea litorea]|uniref:hypothetical protein n=1 Tax=Thalassotalea litorea TaxID=2020715 RepID=UPI003734F655